eukprot:1161075-Pelagomonas_calceolata.AAC.23
MSPGPAIYLGGFERKSSPVILLGPPDSPRCALGASHTDDHGAPAKPKTTSARSSPPKTRVLHSLVLGQPRHMLFQHQQQTLGEQPCCALAPACSLLPVAWILDRDACSRCGANICAHLRNCEYESRFSCAGKFSPFCGGARVQLFFSSVGDPASFGTGAVSTSGGGAHVSHVPGDASLSQPKKHPVSASPKPSTTVDRADAEHVGKDSAWQSPDLDTGVHLFPS